MRRHRASGVAHSDLHREHNRIIQRVFNKGAIYKDLGGIKGSHQVEVTLDWWHWSISTPRHKGVNYLEGESPMDWATLRRAMVFKWNWQLKVPLQWGTLGIINTLFLLSSFPLISCQVSLMVELKQKPAGKRVDWHTLYRLASCGREG